MNDVGSCVPGDPAPQLGESTYYSDVIMADLAPFKEAGGIGKAMFERALDRGVLYQVIEHKLYRGRKCMFPVRCSGVEHFLLKLVDDLPNMEFVVNVQDYPQAPKHSSVLIPIFSFSKVRLT